MGGIIVGFIIGSAVVLILHVIGWVIEFRKGLR